VAAVDLKDNSIVVCSPDFAKPFAIHCDVSYRKAVSMSKLPVKPKTSNAARNQATMTDQ